MAWVVASRVALAHPPLTPCVKESLRMGMCGLGLPLLLAPLTVKTPAGAQTLSAQCQLVTSAGPVTPRSSLLPLGVRDASH